MTARRDTRTAPRTLITGGFGFLAAWTAAGLLRCGHEVIAVDNRPVGGTPLDLAGLADEPGLTTVRADVTRPGALDPCGEVDHVIHAAAVLGVDAVRAAPTETLRVNIDGTATALAYAAAQPALHRFVLLSTSEVYGSDAGDAAEGDWLSVRTDDPRWSYAVSKVTAESMTAAYGTEHGLPYTVVRPFNVYGPLRGGSYAVGAMARQAVRGEPVTVHGDGKQGRTWCHVEDFARGLVGCLRSDEALGHAFNIGDDRNHLTVSELARLLKEVSGSASPVRHIDRNGPDIQNRRPDLSRARTLLGYEPERDLVEGLRETVQWISGGARNWQPRLRRADWPSAAVPGAGAAEPGVRR
ncbi:NAD-dependent epimerase/dehydratase family protein [Streptomyces sp. NPDC088789]|uniref:NAD-dependent epimerase/dehydratase family protein n=1 Tax=Streptomyces sp. NPDC088789 TaxID=3365899 RepID=UPI00382E6771